jgi:tripartite-type tricarboxylate transporter receptor subunit TctC
MLPDSVVSNVVRSSKARGLIAVIACATAAAVLDWIPHAAAQTYPQRPIRLIAPYPSGGGIDTVARALAEKLAPRLGQSIVVDNRPGAGATIGAELLARSAADGYTLMLGSIIDYSIAPHFHRNLSFDMSRDFAAIVELGYGTIGVVVAPSLPAKSVKELIALAKAKPGEIVYASSGHGGLIHLNAEMFMQMTGVRLVHVPYKGSTQLQPDLLSGRVHMSIDNVLAHLGQIRSGKLRVLAVASKQRSPLLPDAPTMAEAGVPGFESATNYTLFAPAGTNKEILALLNKESNTVVAQPDFRDKLLALGIVVTGSTLEDVQARVPAEMARWAKVIKAGNIQPQ